MLDQQQLEDMKWALKRHCSERDYILFVVGCETGLRVQDLLKLTTKQVLDLKTKQHKILRVKEGKAQKIRDMYMRIAFRRSMSTPKTSRVPFYSRPGRANAPLLPLLRPTGS